jgi:hypothetical protein
MKSVLRESRRVEDCETKERGNARAAGVRRGRLQLVRREMGWEDGRPQAATTTGRRRAS